MPTIDAAIALAADRAHLWHPYAGTINLCPLLQVTGANGCQLQLHCGTRSYEVIDAMASWWCAVHGYRHPHLDAAANRQLADFSHVMFGGLTHQPAIALAERLVALAPPALTRVFLTDSGSVAMEVALKLARQLQLARAARNGNTVKRTRFAALRGAYHGDTWGAMSLCDPHGGMHAMYAGAVQQHLFLPRPPAFAAPDDQMQAWVAEATSLIAAARDELAGIVVEPILQGAGGMWPWSPAALAALRRLADEYELVLIADEIATGFGRTGRLFACEWADIVPDIMAVGKALTGGYLTQAAVITTEQISREISQGPGGALMHGPTFMANPLASAISTASLELIADGAWRTAVPRAEQTLTAELAGLTALPGVHQVRVLGATAAVELTRPVELPRATQTALDNGVWLRPFGRLVYTMPPYTATPKELITIAAAIRAVVTEQAQ